MSLEETGEGALPLGCLLGLIILSPERPVEQRCSHGHEAFFNILSTERRTLLNASSLSVLMAVAEKRAHYHVLKAPFKCPAACVISVDGPSGRIDLVPHNAHASRAGHHFAVQLSEPQLEVGKGCRVGDVVHQQHAFGAPEVVGHDRPELHVAGIVPQ